MYPHGIVYQSGKSGNHSEFRLHPGLSGRLVYHFARTLGTGLIAFAIVGLIFSFWPIFQAEINYRFFGKSASLSTVTDVNIAETDAAALGLDPYFSIYIPKIDAKANVIPNVDTGNPADYLEALKKGVAHAKGTNFPGQGKLIYIFSHSTDSPLNFARYNAVFYLLNQLQKGDTITVFFLNQEYDYQVTDEYITSPGDTSWLTDAGNGEELILQTCDPPGTSLRRLLVIAKPVQGTVSVQQLTTPNN
jgi:sortase A